MSDSMQLVPMPGISLLKGFNFNEGTFAQLDNALKGLVNCNLQLSVSIEKLINLVDIFSNIMIDSSTRSGNLKSVSNQDIKAPKSDRDNEVVKSASKDVNEGIFIKEIIPGFAARFTNVLFEKFNYVNDFLQKKVSVPERSEPIQKIPTSVYNKIQSGTTRGARVIDSTDRVKSDAGLSYLPFSAQANPLTSEYLSVVSNIANKSYDVFNHFFNDDSGFPNNSIYSPTLKDPRGIRNNNPGNINFAKQKGATLERPDGRFAKFESAYDGISAIGRQLLRYYDGKTTGKKLQTLNDIIYTWAPPKDNNNSKAYVAALANKMGVNPGALLNLRDPIVLSSLIDGIIFHENGRNPYSNEVIQAAASNAISPIVNHQTHIYISGVSDPIMAGDEVEKRQTNIYSRYAQMTIPGVT